MYEENKGNLVANIIKILLVVLVLALTVKMITIIIKNNENKANEKQMSDNINKVNEIAKNYFKDDLLPSESGKKNKIYLETLEKQGLLKEIKDVNGKKCDMKKSYIEITRLDKEYQIKTYLICDKQSDFLNSFIPLENASDNTTTTTKKTTTKKTTTSKKTTTTTTKATTTTTSTTTTKKAVKQYTITFNTNGGNELNGIQVNENTKASLPTPVREGYTFLGWYYHGEKFNENTVINQNYVLVARWS